MALSEDSRSLLQLLLARGKSYGDIADLLGVRESEVRRRARTALQEIGGTDPDRHAELTDYLLGQADPIARAETAKAIRENPEAHDTAADLEAQLRLLVPGADLPKLDPTAASLGRGRGARGSGGDRPKKSSRRRQDSSAGFFSNLSIPQRRLLAVLVLAAALVAVVIAIVLLGGSGDDGDAAGEQPAPTTAVLRPIDGEQGRGVIQFGFSGADFAADLQISELEPSAGGQSYALWLSGSGGAFPINQARVNDSGAITGQVVINEAILCLIASDFFTEMRLSQVGNAELRRSINQAVQTEGQANPDSLPEFVGDTVLDGPISMPQEAKDEILRICNG